MGPLIWQSIILIVEFFRNDTGRSHAVNAASKRIAVFWANSGTMRAPSVKKFVAPITQLFAQFWLIAWIWIFPGELVTYAISYAACVNLPANWNVRVSSVNTRDNCIVVWEHGDCAEKELDPDTVTSVHLCVTPSSAQQYAEYPPKQSQSM